MIELQKAAVYCGTYKKYNEGSLAGAWMQLNNYATWQEFDKACHELHSDEKTPEFMFQDKEYLPVEYYNEGYIYPELFQVLTTLRGWNEQKLNALDAYMEKHACIPDMFDLEEFDAQYKPQQEAKETDNSDLLQEYKKQVDEDEAKQTIAVIKIKNGCYYTFSKELLNIEKTFCWRYGYCMPEKEANELCSNFGAKEFKEKNLKNFDRATEDENEFRKPQYNELWFGKNYLKSDTAKKYWIKSGSNYPVREEKEDIHLTEDESKAFKTEYLRIRKELHEKFETKIDTYLKKYGTSKIRKWTYWADA